MSARRHLNHSLVFLQTDAEAILRRTLSLPFRKIDAAGLRAEVFHIQPRYFLFLQGTSMMYGAEDVSLSSFNHHRSVHIFQLHIFSLQAISQAVDK